MRKQTSFPRIWELTFFFLGYGFGGVVLAAEGRGGGWGRGGGGGLVEGGGG